MGSGSVNRDYYRGADFVALPAGRVPFNEG